MTSIYKPVKVLDNSELMSVDTPTDLPLWPSQTRYAREIYNHTGREVTVVEHQGMRYTVPSTEGRGLVGNIVVKENWVFPSDVGSKVVAYLKSQRVKDTHNFVKSIFEVGTPVVSEIGDECHVRIMTIIDSDVLNDTKSVYHANTNLLFSFRALEDAPTNPMSKEGVEELIALNSGLHSLNNYSEQIDLIDNEDCTPNGIYLCASKNNYRHIQPTKQSKRLDGLHIHSKEPGKELSTIHIPIEELVNQTEIGGRYTLFTNRQAMDAHYTEEEEEKEKLKQERDKQIQELKNMEIAHKKELLELESTSQQRRDEIETKNRELENEMKALRHKEAGESYKQKKDELDMKTLVVGIGVIGSLLTLYNKYG